MSSFVRPRWAGFGRAALIGAFVALFGAPTGVQAQDLADKYEQMRNKPVQRAQFSLHADPVVLLNANQFQCGLRNNGDTCADAFDSPTGGGGFWPTGSPNQYMFNSGIMIAGVIPEGEGPAEWSGDTVGAYFMDARGTQQHGTPITNIYNSLDPADLANWPIEGSIPGFPEATAYIRDTDIFADILIGRKAGSQQDSWVMYWDGDPGLSANRDHPMGITIEQRTMAWNFPSGNEATIYIFYKITNVTDNETFQSLNETRFAIDLPDEGWRMEDIYLAYDADPDVTTDATENFASVILPFNMGIAYHSQFVAPEFAYPPSLFFPPFFTQAPGIVGVQYLKSPVDPETGQEVGLTMFSVHENPGSCSGLCDPLGVKQLWRYISGNVSVGLGDPPCSFTDPQESRICYLPQQPADARFFQASGPFSLDAGESTTIVVAMMAAATVNTPEIVPGADNPPGIPGLQPGCSDDILPIEVGAGWVDTPQILCDTTAAGQPIDLRGVDVVAGSLLGKGQVAQAVFDENFLLPFAPEPPEFYLVPGDNQIAIVWERSNTENPVIDEETGDTIGGGDPFFEAASDPTSALYNPNYRQFDVEGYRIYKSTDNSNFELIAQFDYETSTFVDVRCEADRHFVPGDTCADTTVLNINDTEDIDDDLLIDPFVLFGGATAQRVRLANNEVLAIVGDTATPGATPDLTDTGVPFGFVDHDVRNGFRYFYQVRAFDINSTFSGPISLESSSETKNAIPQASAPNQVLASFTAQMLGGGDVVLNPDADLPILDEEDGTFSGPMPPTNALEATFVPLVERLLPQFSLTWQIDSIVPHAFSSAECAGLPAMTLELAMCWNMHVTLDKDGTVTERVVRGITPGWNAGFGDPAAIEYLLGAADITADSASLEEFGAPAGFVDLAAGVAGTFSEYIFFSPWVGQLTRRYGTDFTAGGSRWFEGENETLADPAAFIQHGQLTGVDSIFGFEHHTPLNPTEAVLPNSGIVQYFGYALGWLARAADYEIVWGENGAVTITDLTHNVPVDFKPGVQASYGFLNDDADPIDGVGVISWLDFFQIRNIKDHLEEVAGISTALALPNTPVDLEETAELVPISMSTGYPPAQQGTGVAMVINGERWIFQMDALPAAGTTWKLRTYAGTIEADGATTYDPSGYVFSSASPEGNPIIRPPMVPHLRLQFATTERTQLVGASDLSQVHTVPDPYYAQSRYDLSPVEKALRFVNLPAAATIRIYTVSGLLVDVLNHNDPAGGGLATWDLKNRSGQFVASGVYFYHVSTPDGQERIGRFTVINSGIGQ